MSRSRRILTVLVCFLFIFVSSAHFFSTFSNSRFSEPESIRMVSPAPKEVKLCCFEGSPWGCRLPAHPDSRRRTPAKNRESAALPFLFLASICFLPLPFFFKYSTGIFFLRLKPCEMYVKRDCIALFYRTIQSLKTRNLSQNFLFIF